MRRQDLEGRKINCNMAGYLDGSDNSDNSELSESSEKSEKSEPSE